VSEFAAAMTEALDWASANEDAVRAAIVDNMGIPEAAAESITLPEFTSEVDVAAIEELVALAIEFGVLDAEPDLDALIQPQ
jgi:NitT/TauT family transport system substrate-binding protein